jgi:predicted TIM-barrel fold metal-dependent hydrolase
VIIDAHAHLVAPETLYAYLSMLRASGGTYPNPKPVADEALAASAAGNIKIMDSVGTDVQLISPRPFQLNHSAKPARVVHLWVRAINDTIARTVTMHPTRFRGVAGLPQVAGEPVETCFEEIDRCINELGFVGILLNPDPGEGDSRTPNLGDRYWYPLWEKLVKMDVPAHIHSAGCYNGREVYDEHFSAEETLAVISIYRSRVFDDFPSLKLMMSHGGGSIPFQIGRWRSHHALHGRHMGTKWKSFDEFFRTFYFDTCVYTKEPLELLFKIAGPDRCLFGTEKPGSGSGLDPETGRSYDDVKPTIESIASLTSADKKSIFEDNARLVFSRIEGSKAAAR